MIRTICLLMLFTSIAGTSIAQQAAPKKEQIFDLPADFAHRRFTIDLGDGNKMQVELVDMEDLKKVQNMDSIISVFLSSLQPLKDSLGEELQSRRIDYINDTAATKKIRIQRFYQSSSSYAVENGTAAALKLEQDTIHLIGTVAFTAKYTMRKPFATTRHYRVSFFLNDYTDLNTIEKGRLNALIQDIENKINSNWVSVDSRQKVYLKQQPLISARLPKGYVAGGDFLTVRMSVDVQNYKKYFVPSFSLGAGLIISNSHFKRDLMLSWDPHFFFATNSEGKLKTFRNDFITLTAGHGGIRDNEPRKESHLLAIFSLAYLVKREGDFFEKNTFRLGAGRLSLFEGKTKIEPVLYFDNFFKGTTPGVRLIQSF